MQPIFITGIGTGVGKTVIAAIITEALRADYWKPVQAGEEDGTDAGFVQSVISNKETKVFPEAYRLSFPASPHIAARKDNKVIEPEQLQQYFKKYHEPGRQLVIEGAGGVLVPLNERYFVADLIRDLDARVVLVSRNYLGSINHSLLTAHYCRQLGLDVLGWVFNDQYLNYESEIAQWSGLPVIGSIPAAAIIDKTFVLEQAERIRPVLLSLL